MFSKSQLFLALTLLASKAVLAHDSSMDGMGDHSHHSMEYVQPKGYATKTETKSYGTTATADVDSGAYQIGAFVALLGPLFAL